MKLATATVTDQDYRATVRSYANAGTRRGVARYHASACPLVPHSLSPSKSSLSTVLFRSFAEIPGN